MRCQPVNWILLQPILLLNFEGFNESINSSKGPNKFFKMNLPFTLVPNYPTICHRRHVPINDKFHGNRSSSHPRHWPTRLPLHCTERIVNNFHIPDSIPVSRVFIWKGFPCWKIFLSNIRKECGNINIYYRCHKNRGRALAGVATVGGRPVSRCSAALTV